MRKILLLVALPIVLAFAATALAVTSKATVKVQLKEFTLAPAPASVPAGDVTFVVTNRGKLEHELEIVKTAKAPAALPVKSQKAKVASSAVVDEIEDIEPGTTRRMTVKLTAGRYVLLCNLPGHYQAGQRAGLTVR